MPMLDLSALGGASPFGGLLNLGDGSPNYAALNPDAGDTDKLSKLFTDDPYKAMDKKKAEEAAALAARSVFDQGASAVPQAGISGQQAMVPGVYGSLAPQLPQPAAPAPVAAAAPPVAPPVPMPQPRPAAPSTVDDTTIPANAQPTQGQQPAADTSAVPETSMLGRIKKFGSDNSNMLMGMAAGFAGAPSLGTGMSRGFSGAAAGGQLDQKQMLFNQQQMGARATYDALIQAGAPKQQAIVAAFNPEATLSKKLIDTYIGDRKGELKNIKLANGTEISVIHNPYDHTVTDLQGRKLDLNNINGASIDPGLTGQDAADAAQKSDPALYKRAMALVEGRETWPNGRAMNDPKAKAATDLARQIDPQLTEQRALERNTFAKDAGNTAISKVGGQVKAFHQGIDHALTLARNIEKYQPSGGMGLEPVAGVINSARELTTGQKDLANQISTGAQTTAGEVGKLFSGNGGGVHERAETAGRFKSTNSGPASAGALEATLETMEGGLRSIEANRDRVMGEGGSKAPELQFRNKETDAKIAEIKQIIGRLRGEQAAAVQEPGAAAQRKTSTGVGWSVQ